MNAIRCLDKPKVRREDTEHIKSNFNLNCSEKLFHPDLAVSAPAVTHDAAIDDDNILLLLL